MDLRHPARLTAAVAVATTAALATALLAVWVLRVVVALGLLLIPAP